jgi:hypothetical protein
MALPDKARIDADRNSDKAGRFERLAERRVTEVLRKMRLIGNLANRRNYTYTDEHVKQIIDALESELRQVKAKFRHETTAQEQVFSFRK